MKTIKSIILVVMLTMVTSASAMSYGEARNEALFLADKMAYELNLTDEQYEAAYEINLDYLMHVNRYADAYGAYWRMRNRNLAAILADWQYAAYEAATYFYRPLAWVDHVLSLRIYNRYPSPRRFYRARPAVYYSYRGDHGRNYYASRDWDRPARRAVRVQPARREQMQPARQNRSWNSQMHRENVNNRNRSWNASAMNKAASRNTRSWGNSGRTVQNNRSLARMQQRSKSTNASFGNGRRTNNDKQLLAQNDKPNRNTRSFSR